MTSTTILSAVSFGTSTNKGMFFNPVKTTLQAGTTALFIACRLIRGSANVQQNSSMRIRHAVSPTSYATAADGADALRLASEYVELPFRGGIQLSLERSSDLLITAAGYHYCWVETVDLTEAATITVTLHELP